MPEKNLLDGDPYFCQCQKTARLIAASLELGDDDWQIVFQSRVGRDEWLRPYADETIAELGGSGVGRLDVVCPGFAADCLETLEEIAIQNGELFQENGGGDLHYIPALNARDDHIAMLRDLIDRHLSGWSSHTQDVPKKLARERAKAMGASL